MKCLVRNKIAGRNFGFLLPCNAETAKGFCDMALEGTYSIYENTTSVGNEEVANNVWRVTVTGKSQAGLKASFSFYAKGNLNENEITSALKDITINGVKFDEVYIIDMSLIVVAGE